MSKHTEANRRWAQARAYFVSLGLIPAGAEGRKWVLHHIDDKMKQEDPDRYAMWRPQDLWPMTRAEHAKLHHIGVQFSDEHCRRISENRRGNFREGTTLSEETRAKISAAHMGMSPTQAARAKISSTKTGQRWWTNGSKTTQSKTCPGAEWRPGRRTHEHRT